MFCPRALVARLPRPDCLDAFRVDLSRPRLPAGRLFALRPLCVVLLVPLVEQRHSLGLMRTYTRTPAPGRFCDTGGCGGSARVRVRF